MAVKVAINGFGRIGRLAFRQMFGAEGYEVVAINDLTSPKMLAHLLKYDSSQGKYALADTVSAGEDSITVNGKTLKIYKEPDANNCPWGELGVDVVLECSGFYTSKEKAQAHINAGAKKVVISAPAGNDLPTIVYNVNHTTLTKEDKIISAASCTTNCLAPLCKVIQDNYGIEMGLMSTIHAATAKQKVVDAKSLKDWRTGRAVFGNMIPTTTGAAKAVGLVIPEVAGKLTGIAYRVPTVDVSIIDVNLMLKTPTSYADICQKMKEAAEGPLKEVIEYVDDEVVTSDFIGCPQPCAFDARQGIELNDRFFKFVAYYDNEWGYTCNMLRLVKHMWEEDNK